MAPIGVAVVGLGVIGKTHVKVLKELERETGLIKLVAVVDQVSAVAEDVAKQAGTLAYNTIDAVLRNPDVCLLTLATPSYMHAPQALLAMEYGKDVITEKPMATTLAGAKEMISKARKLGRRLGVVFQERYTPDLKFLKSEIGRGVLGKVFLIQAELNWYRDEREYYNKDELARSWRGMWNTEGGGVLTNQGIHTVDLLQWLGGNVEEVSGFIANLDHPSVTVEDTAVAAMRYASGALGTLSQTVNVRPKRFQSRRLRVFGTMGQAEVQDNQLVAFRTEEGSEVKAGGEAKPKADTITQAGNLHKELFRDYLKEYSEGREFPVNGEEGYKALEIIKAIYLSSSTRTVQRLPLKVDVMI
jgi:UDP-N-acetyl-2-amino-2-deoxyglucuronate dehydrogenase